MIEDFKEIETIINSLLEIEDIKEYEKNNTQKYKDSIYILEEYSKFLARKTVTYNEPELKDLNSLLDKLSDKHSELESFVNNVKKQVQVCISSKQLSEDIKKLMEQNDLEEIQIKEDGEYEKLIGRIIDNFSYIKENSEEDSLETYLAFKQTRELMNKHKSLKDMCEDLLYSKVDKKIEIEELKKQREQAIENQVKSDKLEANLKSLDEEIIYYYNNPGFNENKYKDFLDKLAEYDKELFNLKDKMSEGQYNRMLEVYYKSDVNLQTLYTQLNKELEENKSITR